MNELHSNELPESVVSLAGAFRFRLGATSYVIPADLEPNIRALAGLVDDVEVVLFESEQYSNLPDVSVIETMRQVSDAHSLSYTIHFPLDIDLGAHDVNERHRSVIQCLRIIALTQPLHPFAYVLHLPPQPRLADSNTADGIWNWQRRCIESVNIVLTESGILARDICVENLSYPFEDIYPVVTACDVSVCLDIGHVLLNRYSLEQYLTRYLERARVIHLHGIENGTDHCSLAHLPEALMTKLMRSLNASTIERVLTMEVFGTDHFVSSMNFMKGFTKWVKSL